MSLHKITFTELKFNKEKNIPLNVFLLIGFRGCIENIEHVATNIVGHLTEFQG